MDKKEQKEKHFYIKRTNKEQGEPEFSEKNSSISVQETKFELPSKQIVAAQ